MLEHAPASATESEPTIQVTCLGNKCASVMIHRALTSTQRTRAAQRQQKVLGGTMFAYHAAPAVSMKRARKRSPIFGGERAKFASVVHALRHARANSAAPRGASSRLFVYPSQ